MAKKKKIDGVPPFLPIDWRAWESSPLIGSMTDTQLGIALKIMLKQWVLGSVPRSAWELARQIRSDFNTTSRFLVAHSKFLACCECGESWTPVDCQCGESEETGRCQSIKLKNFMNDVNSGLELGTTEPNLTYIEPKETSPSEEVDDEVSYSPEIGNKTPGKTEEKIESTNAEEGELNAPLVSRVFMEKFGLKMKPRKSFFTWDFCNSAFEEFLKTHDQEEVLKVIQSASDSPHYKRGAQTVNADKQRPWDWFIEKYEDMLDKMNADIEFQKSIAKKVRAAASGHTVSNPDLHTGKDAQGKDWTEDATKI
jgi:hypothetical protein